MSQESNEFEKLVRALLRLAGYRVTEEKLVGHKKIDSYAEETTLTSIKRVAVECKSYGSRLTQKQVSEIYSNYLPLYRDNKIDEILIISIHGLAPSAVTMVEITRELNHLTLAELQNRVIDFRAYLPSLVREYESRGLPHYYIPLKSNSGLELEPQILDWLQGGPAPPIAILAGYGMGKSTFAAHLAAQLAQQAIAETTNRIPILVPLGEISSNQDLAGLLGKLFTYTYDVRNYRLESFLELNALGRFAVICDGFDEMKHTLSWEEFRFNLMEINRLVNGNSRLIILGRPTAFLSEMEHQYALHGSLSLKGQDLRDRDWPDYLEIELASFDRKQMEVFLDKYQKWLIERELHNRSDSAVLSVEKKKAIRTSLAAKRSKRVLNEIERSSTSGGSNQLADLVERPVHLKMLIDVLQQWRGDITQMTVTILYNLFIDSLMEREQSKQGRREGFTGADRRKFGRKLAWWLWQRGKRAYLRAQEFPDDLLFLFGQTRLEGVRRDLIAGSLLDRKAGDVLYFAHRSIQEFLVAEELVETVPQGLSMSIVNAALTDEVYTFLENMLNTDDLARWEVALKGYRGTLSWNLGRLWVSDPEKLRWTIERLNESSVSWYGLFATAAVCKEPRRDIPASNRLAARLVSKIGTTSEPAHDLLCFACVMGLSKRVGTSYASQALERILDINIVARSRPRDTRPKKKRREKPLQSSEPRRIERIETDVDRWLKFLRLNKRSQLVHLENGHFILSSVLQRYCFLSDWITESAIRADEFVLLQDIEVPNQLIQRFEEWSKIGHEEIPSSKRRIPAV